MLDVDVRSECDRAWWQGTVCFVASANAHATSGLSWAEHCAFDVLGHRLHRTRQGRWNRRAVASRADAHTDTKWRMERVARSSMHPRLRLQRGLRPAELDVVPRGRRALS